MYFQKTNVKAKFFYRHAGNKIDIPKQDVSMGIRTEKDVERECRRLSQKLNQTVESELISWDYEFIYWDASKVTKSGKKGTNVKLARKHIPANISNDKDAEKFCKAQEAVLETAAFRLRQKLEWRSKFYKFPDLVEIYKKDREKTAPNSWKNHVHCLEQYVLPYFLNTLETNNINQWPNHYEQFKEYLEEDATTSKQRRTGKLAYNTMNHCVIALNTFIDTMKRKNQCDKDLPSCPLFPDHKMATRSFEDIVSDEEIKTVFDVLLKSTDKTPAHFFWTLAHTGLRLNEGIGLSLNDIISGPSSNPDFMRALNAYGIQCHSYIDLQSQPKLREIRNDKGIVERKPLKGKDKKKVSERGRIIPIAEKDTHNYLATLWQAQMINFNNKKYGTDKSNYLLFDGLTKGKFTAKLAQAFKDAKLKYKSPHLLRHTYCTKLAGQTMGNTMLCRAILGHTKSETVDKYIHIYGQLYKTAQVDKQIASGGMTIIK